MPTPSSNADFMRLALAQGRLALGNLSGDCSGVTAFVTLEPRSVCWQRTRPKTWPSFWCASRSRLAGDGRQR
ncbi:hypothetical protein [Pseudomonas yamanorum]|uniref:hypothetical protein n=1 Tax=Pseudomonas yamanorum TaxID=515393 RepID=UPI0015A06DC2|nr:hypothetical protein [Pseudomonas yamanorum]NVZ84376.1 hypothetical protein [Pseudomonas yamanorum]